MPSQMRTTPDPHFLRGQPGPGLREGEWKQPATLSMLADGEWDQASQVIGDRGQGAGQWK